MKNTSKKQFPQLLYAMLETAALRDGSGCSNSVTWLAHGHAFKILDQREFIEVTVPMFFKQTKIRSFYRQLNLWGYKRVSSGIDVGAYYNKHFVRGRPEKMKEMVRVKIKGRVPKNDSKQDDPDINTMPTNRSCHGGGQVKSNNCDNSQHSLAINDPILKPALSRVGRNVSSPSFGDDVLTWTMPTMRPHLPEPSTASSRRVSFGNEVEEDRLSDGNLEPLQFDEVNLDYRELPFDELAKYINTAIQRL